MYFERGRERGRERNNLLNVPMKGTVIEEHLQTDISVRPIAHFLTTFLISKTETPTWNTTCEELNNPWSPGQGATYEVRCTRLFAIGELLWNSAAWLIDFEFYLWHLLLNLTHVGFVNQSAIPCMTIRKITHTSIRQNAYITSPS